MRTGMIYIMQIIRNIVYYCYIFDLKQKYLTIQMKNMIVIILRLKGLHGPTDIAWNVYGPTQINKIFIYLYYLDHSQYAQYIRKTQSSKRLILVGIIKEAAGIGGTLGTGRLFDR